MKLLRRLFLLLLLLAAIGFVVAWTLPAKLALRWFKPDLGPLQLAGISGTVWQGQASSVSAFGTPLGAMRWSVDKSPLLLRRIAARVNLSGGAITFDGDVTRDADGSVLVQNMAFQLPAETAAPALDIPALKLHGSINGRIDDARVAGGWVSGARGSAHWREAAVSGEAEARLGELVAEFASQPDGSISGTVRDNASSNLEVAGQFVVNSGQFSATARLAARNGDRQVAEALRYIGEPQPDGSSQLKINGHLFKLF
ncbi:MAG: type II secretion system protein N [Rhodanobacteraceae bacterium]|nr:type II secretion system protein N [Rhodanobacteraceae bacterium]